VVLQHKTLFATVMFFVIFHTIVSYGNVLRWVNANNEKKNIRKRQQAYLPTIILLLMLTSLKQESRAIAKMTTRCAQCMGALEMFGTS